MNTRNALLVAIFLMVNFLSSAQKIKILESSEQIGDVSKSGLYVLIDLDAKHIEKAWERHLKTFGRVENSKGFFSIPAANIRSVSSSNCNVFSNVQSTSRGVKVWWALDLGNSYVTSVSNNRAYKAAEKILYDFAMTVYKTDINEQIEAAEQAFGTSVKNREKQQKHGEHLKKAVEKNKEEKIKLEKALQANKDNLIQLEKDIEKNKEDQKSATSDEENMKKAVELVKEKLKEVN
ncbi:MAG TPA: hypothetical protein VF691_06530 [Cytophagaceae bacterium]|jgi:hypothetical protein